MNKILVPYQKNKSTAVISKEAIKLQYNAGEKFDPTGMEITVTFVDGTTEVIKDFISSDFLFKELEPEDLVQELDITDSKGLVHHLTQRIKVGDAPLKQCIADLIIDKDCIDSFISLEGTGIYTYGTEIHVKANLKPNQVFLGWFDKLGNEVSNQKEFSFKLYDNVQYFAKATPAAVVTSEPDYLCITALEDNCFVEMIIEGDLDPVPMLQYSTDKTNWYDFFIGTTAIKLQHDESIYFKGQNDSFSQSLTKYVMFKISKKAKCSGTVMTLLDPSGELKEIPNRGCFARLFSDTPITTMPKLTATVLKDYCYECMFSECHDLKEIVVPQAELAFACYEQMLWGNKNMTDIKVMFEEWRPKNEKIPYTDFWLAYSDESLIPSEGIFHCPSTLPVHFGANYIPKGWKVEFYDNYNIDLKARLECTDMFDELVGTGVYPEGKMIKLVAKVKLDYRFKAWYNSLGKLISTEPEITVEVSHNETYFAKAE